MRDVWDCEGRQSYRGLLGLLPVFQLSVFALVSFQDYLAARCGLLLSVIMSVLHTHTQYSYILVDGWYLVTAKLVIPN